MKEKLSALQRSAANRLWNDFLGPRHKWRFKMRIALRVQWLFFKRWWNESVSLRGLLSGLRRPTILLLIGLGIPVLMYWMMPTDIWFALSDSDSPPRFKGSVDWRFLIQPILLFIGLPSAFILWAFRDHNASAALENQRKDINLKEFQEIQLRAAGALDEKLPAKARETLQVAAIHQLRPFLRGEYGASFRRPAWELLKALLATSAQESGYVTIREWVDRGRFAEVEGESTSERALRNRSGINDKIRAISLDAVALAGQMVISEEAQSLLCTDLPIEAGSFDGIGLRNALLSRLQLSHASFVGADLFMAHMEGCNLSSAYLMGAKLSAAHLEGADLSNANLQGADLSYAHLEGAKLNGANLEGATFYSAFLVGADLSEAQLAAARFKHARLEGALLRETKGFEDAILRNSTYDDETQFRNNWNEYRKNEREAERKPWRDQGMRHVDEVKRDK